MELNESEEYFTANSTWDIEDQSLKITESDSTVASDVTKGDLFDTPVMKEHRSAVSRFEPNKESGVPENSNEVNSIFLTLKNSKTKVPNISEFKIVKPISRGAFGTVYLGYKQSDSKKLFAIKVIDKNHIVKKNMMSTAMSERNALALTQSPFCVHLYYSLQSLTHIFLVMEYMIGGDLKSLLTTFGFFEEDMAVFYVAEVCLALHYLHSHGITHRDIKPDNMLLSRDGHVKLTDFGLSQISIKRDLQLEDFEACTPALCMRTPGQLISLTSHFTFGSAGSVRSSGTSDNSSDSRIRQNVKPDMNITNQILDTLDVSSEKEQSTLNVTKLNETAIRKTEVSLDSFRSGSDDSVKIDTQEQSGEVIRRKRKRQDKSSSENSSNTTGLTQEISAIEFTPKRRNVRESPNYNVAFQPADNSSSNENKTHKSASFVFSTPVSMVNKKCSTKGSVSVEQKKIVYRTPKSVRKRPVSKSQSRVVGTPDYLAPEILKGEPHGPAVDWWSLGVCLYEFSIGLPPFNDDTPEMVFNNILTRRLEFPEGHEALSNNLVSAIEQLLSENQYERPTAKEVMKMKLFSRIDFNNLLSTPPPFIPDFVDERDTKFFQARNELQGINLSDVCCQQWSGSN